MKLWNYGIVKLSSVQRINARNPSHVTKMVREYSFSKSFSIYASPSMPEAQESNSMNTHNFKYYY